MPNLNGTGPQGEGPLTGRRRGRCRDTEKSETQKNPSENKDVIYGLGRGGKPHGGGTGKGQGRRKGFGRNQTFSK
jgi:hypothetical protein